MGAPSGMRLVMRRDLKNKGESAPHKAGDSVLTPLGCGKVVEVIENLGKLMVEFDDGRSRPYRLDRVSKLPAYRVNHEAGLNYRKSPDFDDRLEKVIANKKL